MPQARVRESWEAGRQPRGPRLVYDEVEPTAAVPLQDVRLEPPRKAGYRVRGLWSTDSHREPDGRHDPQAPESLTTSSRNPARSASDFPHDGTDRRLGQVGAFDNSEGCGWTFSGLLSRGSQVRVLPGAPTRANKGYLTASARGATVVVPPNKTARVSRRRPRSSARDRTITKMKRIGRRRWQQEAGYSRQARVEKAFFRYKLIIGSRLRARSPGGRATETVVACNILNQMTELGRPKSYRIGR